MLVQRVGDRDYIQVDIRGMRLDDIDFHQMVSLRVGNEESIADHWHEVELAMAGRNARLQFMDHPETKNMLTIQFGIEARNAKFATQLNKSKLGVARGV